MTESNALPGFWKWLGGILALTAVYFVAGRLGLLLVVPPGLVSGIFPPAGIALAALLLFGYRFWPSVLLGSFSMNVWLSATTLETFTLTGLVVPAAIGLGASLQALLGAALIRRFVTAPTVLDGEWDIIKFLLYGGPLSCMVGATVGVSSLRLGGMIGPLDVPFNWWAWWVGDTIGVLIVAPLVFVVLARPREIWRKRRLTVALPLIVASIVVTAIFLRVSAWEADRIKHDFLDNATNVAHAVDVEIIDYRSVVDSIERFFSSSTTVTPAEFRTFVKRSLQKHPGIRALEWIPRVTHKDRAAFEADVRATRFPNFRIRERSKDGTLKPAAARQEYFPVTYVEPLSGNDSALGFDLASNPARLAALNKARDTGAQVATARIRLVQEKGEQFGFLLFHPIYRTDMPASNSQERRAALMGFALGVLRIGKVIEDALTSLPGQGYSMRLNDLSAPEENRLLYGDALSGERSAAKDLHLSVVLAVADRKWSLDFLPPPDYMAAGRAWQAWAVLAGGLIFASLLQALLLILTGRAERTEQLVLDRTKDLSRSEERANAIVRNALDAIITIDARGIIETFNPMAQQIFGYGEDEIIGRNVSTLMPEPHHSNHDGYLANYLRTGDAKIIGTGREVSGLRRDGSVFPMDLSVSDIRVGEETRFAGIVRDLSERKKIENIKNEFISMVSHELRTPLTSIMGSLGLVKAGVGGELPIKAGTMIEIAHKNSDRLVRLINDILDIEKIASGKMDFRMESLEVMSLVHQALEANKGYGERHGVEFVLVGDLADARVQGDQDRLMQVFANLLSNAAKYSPEGEKVKISLARRTGAVRIEVTDKGSGVPEDFHDRLFEKFSQADSSDTRQKGGTGLGLSIAKAIMEKHGGTIGLDLEADQGTTFFFELPEKEG
jgi:PAS domain S-box-containing protein